MEQWRDRTDLRSCSTELLIETHVAPTGRLHGPHVYLENDATALIAIQVSVIIA
jgi:hypothetical protein